MRIVHIVSYYHAELKYQEYHLVREQLKAGHEVIIVTSERKYPMPNYEKSFLPTWGQRQMQAGISQDAGATVIRLPIHLEIGSRTWLRGLKRELRALKPDLVHFHGVVQFHTLPILFTQLHKQTRLVVDEHSVETDYSGSKVKQGFFKLWSLLFSKKLQNRAEKIVAISDSSAKVLRNLYGLTSHKVQMIPLGVDTDTFKVDTAFGQQQRAQWKIPNHALVVLYTGKIEAYKYPHLIMDALASVQFQREIHLVFVGNIAVDYQAQMDASRAACAHQCHFFASVGHKELPFVYNACDIAVWPAHQTISTIDASACGKPIICSDYLTERYANENGIGVVPGKFESLQQALQLLLTNDALRLEMGKKGRELVENTMSWKKISDAFLSEL
jgi:glycosyltransferase involved in cell wall biosynthesis